ncbi:hypothetical protein [Bacillus sp. B1-b2]|uniref:hypothetical protein n=1 Tax=Bacillus sp. B1-b2 TaxID=2653201 RepID=UPI001262A2DA|nr:hypothetical protein [Bacillus sp. B1-b2]KAB7665276.1 hypothetical protein F9279_20870 [Bacillus sp. B1-b2]
MVFELQISGTDYIVLDIHYEDLTVLDSMTVLNMEIEELSIIYVGTVASRKYGKQVILTDDSFK